MLTAYHVMNSTDSKTFQTGAPENPLSSATRMNFKVNLRFARNKYRSEKVGKGL